MQHTHFPLFLWFLFLCFHFSPFSFVSSSSAFHPSSLLHPVPFFHLSLPFSAFHDSQCHERQPHELALPCRWRGSHTSPLLSIHLGHLSIDIRKITGNILVPGSPFTRSQRVPSVTTGAVRGLPRAWNCTLLLYKTQFHPHLMMLT